ncbi:MAG TPA: hypothetical protein VMC80_02925 [Patescibacteria group bacterium]|nr:hypothetical protein [Patescibacteria group bacterium]
MSRTLRNFGLVALLLAAGLVPRAHADSKKQETWFSFNKTPYVMQIDNEKASPVDNPNNIVFAEDKNGKWFSDSNNDGVKETNENYAPAGFTAEAGKALTMAKKKIEKGAKVLYHFGYKGNEFVRWSDGTMTFGLWELDQQWVSTARKNGAKNAGLMSPEFNALDEKAQNEYINGLNAQISSYESQIQTPQPQKTGGLESTVVQPPQGNESKDIADLRTQVEGYNSQQTQKINDLQAQIGNYNSQQTQKMNELQTQVTGLASAVQSASTSLTQIISAYQNQAPAPSGTSETPAVAPAQTPQPAAQPQAQAPSGESSQTASTGTEAYIAGPQEPKALTQAELPKLYALPKTETPKVQPKKQSKLELYINALGGPGWVGVTEDADGNTVLTNNLPNNLSSPAWVGGGEIGLTEYSENGFGFGAGIEIAYGFPETLLDINTQSTPTSTGRYYVGNTTNNNFIKIGLNPEIQLGKGNVKAILGLEGALWIYNQNKSSGWYKNGQPVPSDTNVSNPTTETKIHYDFSAGGSVGIKIGWERTTVNYDSRKGLYLEEGVSIPIEKYSQN